ncbi:hypothetical protein CONPUDRAFT_153587 [Coniophora puteana RWD-64-598 SS2]|uniref:Uncharacterized protein n=1 Tax=Coniophora puteana (strain RWD-64-598) TaxID=741705 RepID=A0A5M3MPQ7_CONPW|nr:uncharacterized protein CONPUDRAFT_153587 [Coniophora puteana RWD-64-598 SS2]EIW81037.1 hypothetical protein CONPUDRAFT_153587 [Coniophora puteana RWD-64-598 SS2]
MYASQIANRDVILLYGDSDQEHEAAVFLTGTADQSNTSLVKYTRGSSSDTIITILPGVTSIETIWDSENQLILFADTHTAGSFWAPTIASNDTSNDFANYWQFGTNTSVLVAGPYLVRNATISDITLALRGDLNQSITLSVVAPPQVTAITWNGEAIINDAPASKMLTSSGGFVGHLTFTDPNFTAPVLTNWKYANCLPEIQSNFSDASWTLVNHTSTNIPVAPLYGDGRTWYGCDYDFSSYGTNLVEEVDAPFYFPSGSLNYDPRYNNVITVVQDNMGLDETGYGVNEEKSPRGIRGFELNSGNLGPWMVQGKVGGYTNFPDTLRGVLNEGGLYGERMGWHLPGFNTSFWESRDLSEGLPDSAAGVFFVTTFNLNVPEGYDIPMAFTFDNSTMGQAYRLRLFVNGWMMGHMIANLGPQYKFPVHEGILDYNGTNTVAIALWSMEAEPVSPSVELTLEHVYEGGVGGINTNNPAWSPDGKLLEV